MDKEARRMWGDRIADSVIEARKQIINAGGWLSDISIQCLCEKPDNITVQQFEEFLKACGVQEGDIMYPKLQSCKRCAVGFIIW